MALSVAQWTREQDEQTIKLAFIEIYRKTGNIAAACDGVLVKPKGKSNAAKPLSRRKVKDWMVDQDFAALFELAREEAADRLENEAWRRAVDGVERPVFHRGKQIRYKPRGKKRLEGYYERKYSDGLLTTLLHGTLPEKYAARTEVKSQHLHVHTAAPNGLPAWFGQGLFADDGIEPPPALVVQSVQEGVLPTPLAPAVTLPLAGEPIPPAEPKPRPEPAPAPPPKGQWVYSCGCRNVEMLRCCPEHGAGFVAVSFEDR